MALIDCPDCGKQVSDQASACPACAHPIRAITIEATGKKWKAQQLAFGALILLGFILVFSYPAFGGLLCIAGLTGVIRARVGAWWQHG